MVRDSLVKRFTGARCIARSFHVDDILARIGVLQRESEWVCSELLAGRTSRGPVVVVVRIFESVGD